MHPTVRSERENLHHRSGAAMLKVALIDDPFVDLYAERAHQAHQHRHVRTVTQPGEAPQVVAFPRAVPRFASSGVVGCSAAAEKRELPPDPFVSTGQGFSSWWAIPDLNQ
jgi:hypothetical protein